MHSNSPSSIDATSPLQPGRLLALDLGTKRVGVAVSDELRISIKALAFLERHSWKHLLRQVVALVEAYDARGVVIGLPLSVEGAEGTAAEEARRLAENFRRSLNVPVFLQDERLTTVAAREQMETAGIGQSEIEERIDSESAAIILRDFLVKRT